MKYITLSQYCILPDNTYTIFHYKEQSVYAVQSQTDLNSKNFEELRNVNVHTKCRVSKLSS